MSDVARATFRRLPAKGGKGSPGPAEEVMVNPSTLRFSLQNNVDRGKGSGRQATQSQGSWTSTLSFDLMFDTTGEGSAGAPVDVLKKTRLVEQFLLPDPDTPKSAPPGVEFRYGTMTVTGTVTSASLDLELFSPGGVPIRAKMSVTIQVQDRRLDSKEIGPGANAGAGAAPLPTGRPSAPAGAPGAAAPGVPPGPPADRTALALAGESAAGFAARMGLDPAAWKGLAAGLADPLRLPEGLPIDFPSTLGVARGAAGPVGAVAAAAATTAKGGVAAAIATARAAAAAGEADAARRAFATPGSRPAPPAAGGSGPAAGAAAPQAAPGGVGVAAGAPPPPAPAVDGRQESFGRGVPLRARRGGSRAAAVVVSGVRGARRPAGATPPETDDPTVPPWVALPATPRGVPGAGPEAARAHGCGHPRPCGCGGGR